MKDTDGKKKAIIMRVQIYGWFRVNHQLCSKDELGKHEFGSET
jgi:hypothetical protein